MGHVPIPPLSTSAQSFLALYQRKHERDLRHRRSRLPWRCRRAHAACLTLIRAREAYLGMTPDPWLPKPPNYVQVEASAYRHPEVTLVTDQGTVVAPDKWVATLNTGKRAL